MYSARETYPKLGKHPIRFVTVRECVLGHGVVVKRGGRLHIPGILDHAEEVVPAQNTQNAPDGA